MLLGEYLIEKGLLRPTLRDAAVAEQKVTGEPIGKILVRNGFIKQRDLVEALRHKNPGRLRKETAFVRAIPYRVLADTQTMIMADLPDMIWAATMGRSDRAAKALAPYVGKRPIKFLPGSPQRIDEYLIRARTMGRESDNTLERLLRDALDAGSSDVHIIPRELSYSVLVRHDGVRVPVHEGPLDEYQTLVSQIKDKAHIEIEERRKTQDGAFNIEHNGRRVDLRVATIPSTQGQGVVIRVLDPDRVTPDLSKLGITGVDELRKGLSRPDGLVLITGPTGSGKTTTMTAAVLEMDMLGRAIFSIEDPVEFSMPFVTQVATNDLVGLDFASAVRGFLRADPDVIIVGEIRDIETARIALKAAETGHLVIGTLHTGSILGALGRFRDIGVEPHELKYLLRGVLTQRLIRTICAECKGASCHACSNTGYRGRTIVSECVYLSNEEQVAGIIAGDKWWDSMMDDVRHKLEQGITNIKEVERVFGAEAIDLVEAA